MKLARTIYYALGPYASVQERRVGQFFAKLTEHSALPSVRAQLLTLIQDDIATINLWSEYRYKGYVYLKKKERKKCYVHLQEIAEDFAAFRSQSQPNDALVSRLTTMVPHANVDTSQALLLDTITRYFSHEGGRFEYRDSSSFGRLLRNPRSEKLMGDCNQIVTLYIYLYSRYFDVSDLKLRLLPGHVALHYGGVDIETTTGEWVNYDARAEAKLLPVEEIVSINLLDTTDEHFATHDVDPNDFLQATRFAAILSHERSIVLHNLDAAYAKLINEFMKRHNFAKALKFAKQSRNMELLAVVGTNGAIHHINRHQFKAARTYAAYSTKKDMLIKDSFRAEGVYHYDAQRFHDAVRAFKTYGDASLVRRCYEALFFAEQNTLPKDLTSESIKHHTRTIKRMQDYAKRSGNHDLQKHVDSLRAYL